MFYGQIYKITNLISGKVYIGQTTIGIEKRYKSHVYTSNNSLIHRAINKYGVENFKVEELAACIDREQLDSTEILAIKMFNSLHPNGYNLHMGGTGGELLESTKMKISKKAKERLSKPENNPNFGKRMSDETKEKIRLTKAGKKLTGKHKAKLSKSLSGENNPMYGKKGSLHPSFGKPAHNRGKPHSEETKQKMRGRVSSRKGVTLTDETKNKISQSKKGKKRNPEVVKRIKEMGIFAGENNPRYGVSLSDETKQKISNSLKGKVAHNKGVKLSEEQKELRRRKRRLTFIKKDINYLSKKLNIDISKFSFEDLDDAVKVFYYVKNHEALDITCFDLITKIEQHIQNIDGEVRR